MERVDPYATTQPTKYRDGEVVMLAAHDPATLAALTQLNAALVTISGQLAGIRARLEAGISTKAVATIGTVVL